MKIVVILEVEIEDPDDWTVTFGVEGKAAIRKDVKEYVENAVQHAGALGNGEVSNTVKLRNP